VAEHLTERLATFRGARAVFIHNALYYWGGRAYMGEGDPANHRDEIIANVVSPLVLGDMFVRASQPAVDAGVDVGLVQISSASARIAYPGLAIYGAAKASMERAQGPRQGPVGERHPPGVRRHACRAARSGAPARHAPRYRGHRGGGAHRQHADGRRVRDEHLELDPRSLHRQGGAAVR
jgi:hypothetical protein